MKRNSILAFGVGVLLGVGLLTPGCGDSGSGAKKDGSADARDAKRDGVSTGGTVGTGGRTGTGGTVGTGGAPATGGAPGTGGGSGTGGAPGTGGASGTGGTTGVDAGLGADGSNDVVRRDGAIDQSGSDTPDVPITNPDTAIDTGPVLIDTGLDGAGIDGTVIPDVAIDQSIVDVGAVDAEIDSSGID